MNEINKINLSEQIKFRLSEIIGIENYFYQEINQRKLFTSIGGAPVGIASASFTLIFSITTGLVKILLKTTRNKKKKA